MFKKVGLITLVLCAMASTVMAQTLASGSITTNGQAISAALLNDADNRSIAVQITGTWTGTLTFQGSLDGTNYVSLLGANASSTGTATSTTSNGVFLFTNSGYVTLRVAATASMTGTAVITINRGYGSGGAGSGGGGGSGGTTTDPDDASIAAGQTNDNTNALNMAYDGSVWRRITFYANDATAAGTTMLPVMPCITETSAPTRTNGRMGMCSTTAGGAQRVMITDAAGAASTLATDQTLDAAVGTTGPMMVGRGSAATPTAMSADNDATAVWVDLNGRVQTNMAFLGGAAPSATNPFITTGFPGTLVSGAVTSAMTGTTSTSVVSGTASNYLYITSCAVSNASTTVSTDILLQDGSGGTTLYVLPASAAAVATTGGGGVTHTFGAPLKVPTSGNALYAANVTTGSSTKISCNGFRSTVSY